MTKVIYDYFKNKKKIFSGNIVYFDSSLEDEIFFERYGVLVEQSNI